MILNAVDLFSGCGGLSHGIKKAGFKIRAAIDIDKDAINVYKLNFSQTKIIEKDITIVKASEIKEILNNQKLHLLSACPPCQGFSRIRKLNRKRSAIDERNTLILDFLRLVKELHPVTLMMENVPDLINYHLFKKVVKELKVLGYYLSIDVVNMANYGIPQNRRRLIMVGSKLSPINIAEGKHKTNTVRDAIGNLEPINSTTDTIHKMIYIPSSNVFERIKLIPKDGGSRGVLPQKHVLNCHKNKAIGFRDVYGRLKWNSQSTTITSGCLNPSKGRFLHPDENRSISAREASLLQSFPQNYKFSKEITKTSIARLIGNALPPRFSYIQCMNIKKHLVKYSSY